MTLSDQLASFASSITGLGSGLENLAKITADLVAHGWVKLPLTKNGVVTNFVIQYDTVTIPTGNADVVTFPISFPTACMKVVGCDNGAGCNSVSASLRDKATFSASGKSPGAGAAFASTSYSYIALGT